MTKRMKISVLTSIILGLFCVIGANVRFNGELAGYMVGALFLNRIILGILMGVNWDIEGKVKTYIHTLFIGIIVSLQYYMFTNFTDHVSFIAGIVYAFIIYFIIKNLVSNKKA